MTKKPTPARTATPIFLYTMKQTIAVLAKASHMSLTKYEKFSKEGTSLVMSVTIFPIEMSPKRSGLSFKVFL